MCIFVYLCVFPAVTNGRDWPTQADMTRPCCLKNWRPCLLCTAFHTPHLRVYNFLTAFHTPDLCIIVIYFRANLRHRCREIIQTISGWKFLKILESERKWAAGKKMTLPHIFSPWRPAWGTEVFCQEKIIIFKKYYIFLPFHSFFILKCKVDSHKC